MQLRKILTITVLVLIFVILIPPKLTAQNYIITTDEIPSEIIEGENITIVATIFNNDSSAAVDLKEFNITIRRIIGRYVPRPIRMFSKNLTGIRLVPNTSYTVFIEIKFDLPPDRYNITASFVVRKVGEYRDRVIYVWRTKEIRVKPRGTIPPEIAFVIYSLGGIILVFVAWLLFGIRRK